jgi:exodeoxyribonuclease V
MIELTPHQQDAVDWLVAQIERGSPLIALRGLAGVGKSALIPHLQQRLVALGVPVTIGAPTHRAAMILRQKGLSGADTVHAHALLPYFTPDYVRCLQWLGDNTGAHHLNGDGPLKDIDGLPYLVHEAVKPDLTRGRALTRQRRPSARKRLASLGIHGKDYFAGFGPKKGEGVLIIDEASMVGATMLATCQEAYKQIVLIGDPGQLPPVKDGAVLAGVEGVDLTEVHRQAKDSPILKLAYRARHGEAVWHDRLPGLPSGLTEGGVCSQAQVQATQLLHAPLIVWRNVTRVTCTHQIRQALGYTRDVLAPGEPLVCRSTAQEDRAEGFYNNGLYRVVAVDTTNPRLVTVEDALGDTSTVQVHIEELDGDRVDPKAIPFRLGYCLTAHTAQGGEWPLVYVALPDLLLYAKMCGSHGRQEELAQWTYTAITRAKATLSLLTTYDFLATKEPTMAAPKTPVPSRSLVPEEPPSPDVLFDDAHAPVILEPEPDDIPDPVVPVTLQDTLKNAPGSTQGPPGLPAVPDIALYEALLHGFCQHLQRRLDNDVMDHHRGVMRALDSVCQTVKTWIEGTTQANEHAQYQLSDALLKLPQQGLRLRHDPYTVDVQAVSPQGYPITFHLAKDTAPELLAELPDVVAWLANNQYKPGA